MLTLWVFVDYRVGYPQKTGSSAHFFGIIGGVIRIFLMRFCQPVVRPFVRLLRKIGQILRFRRRVFYIPDHLPDVGKMVEMRGDRRELSRRRVFGRTAWRKGIKRAENGLDGVNTHKKAAEFCPAVEVLALFCRPNCSFNYLCGGNGRNN